MKSLNVVEICAGAGGQSLGLHRAGFEHALAVELDAAAAATLEHNFRRLGLTAEVRVGDVADSEVWKPIEFAEPDLLAGGVPCPPFSVAGKQLGSADERDLFAWSIELAAEMSPKGLLLENVRGLAGPRFSGYRQAIADRLHELGYWSEWKLLQASSFGVPQLRPRFVLVALAAEYAPYFAWPEEDGEVSSVGESLADLMSANGWTHAAEWAGAAHGIGPTVVGGSKKHGGADLGPTRAREAWSKLWVDGRGVADDSPAADHPHFHDRMPRLTNEMVARIQGWGSAGYEWEFLGRKTSVYRQIGNAFPAPVAEAVGKSIGSALAKATDPRDLGIQQQHDDLYKLLRGSKQAQQASTIAAILGIAHSDLKKRLDSLSSDFDVILTGPISDPLIELGRFRAFRGQADHHRHETFAARQSRSRVS